MRFRCTVAYDGTAYHGFQRQAGDTPTIQLELERAIQTVTGEAVTVICAGRTDAGVHAVGQVIAFDVAWQHRDEQLLRAININLPEDIAIQDICQQEGFHPRFDAASRVYQYSVAETPVRQPTIRHYTWQIPRIADLDAMQYAADLLLGEHDFATFGTPPQGTNTIREVFWSRWQVYPQDYGRLLVYTIEATAFLQHMVRRIVALLLKVGRGWIDVNKFEGIFRSADLSKMKDMAPPQGLVLYRVYY